MFLYLKLEWGQRQDFPKKLKVFIFPKLLMQKTTTQWNGMYYVIVESEHSKKITVIATIEIAFTKLIKIK